MKNTVLMAALGTAILVGTGAQGIAQAMGGGMGMMGMGGDGMRPDFQELDADGDGRLTRAEMEKYRQARFAKADTDGDGKLSRAEIDAQIAARQAAMRERMLDRMIGWRDVDGDGMLSPDEMRADRGLRMFAGMDADRDGTISADEFDEMGAWHQRHHRGAGGHMGRHQGDRRGMRGGDGKGRGMQGGMEDGMPGCYD